MPDEQLTRIRELVKVLNKTASDDSNKDLLDYCINEICGRVLLYLNTKTLDEALERIVARIVSGIFNQSVNNQNSTAPDVAISSVSDNGQSVSYSNEVKNYLATADDNELFAGFTKLLARYRRINVVS